MTLHRLLPAALLFLVLGPAMAQRFSVEDVNIPDDGSWKEITITVSGLQVNTGPSFGVQAVCLDVDHPALRELTLMLRSPDGTTVTLISEMGGWNGQNLLGTCLNDSGPNLESGAAPFTGNYRSQMPLGSFNNGSSPNGNWKLLARDNQNGNAGKILRISLEFGEMPAEPFEFSESTLPIVILTTGAAGISDYFKTEVGMKIIDHGKGQINRLSQSDFSFEGKIMAEYQGWSSTNAPKKNIDFNLGGASNPKQVASLAGLPAENDWLLKAEYSDRTLLKNAWSYFTFREMGRWAPRTRFCELVINGQYFGVYTLTEKVKRDSNRLSISKLEQKDNSGDELTGGYIIEMNPTGAQPAWFSVFPPINDATTDFDVEFKHVYPRSNEITPTQHVYIKQFMDDFERSLAGPTFQDPFIGYQSYIDTDSFIDFLILNELTGNYDSYGRSTYLYKEKITKGGKLHMGPPWDYDRTFGYDFPDTTGWVWQITNWYWPFPFWWSKLWSDPEFKSKVECRWASFRAGVLSDENLFKRIDSLDAELQSAGLRNQKIWPDPQGRDRLFYLELLKSFLRGRLAWLDQELRPENRTLPLVSLPDQVEICKGTAFDGRQSGDYVYNWRPGPELPEIIFPNSGSYSLEVASLDGCFTRKHVEVTLVDPDADFEAEAIHGNSDWIFSASTSSHSQYEWNFGDGTIDYSSQSNHAFRENGTYAVQLRVTDKEGCVATKTSEIQVNSVGILAGQLAAFPNPIDDGFTLVVDEELLAKNFEIVNMEGQLLIKGQITGINTWVYLGNFPKGIYIVRVPDRPMARFRFFKP